MQGLGHSARTWLNIPKKGTVADKLPCANAGHAHNINHAVALPSIEDICHEYPGTKPGADNIIDSAYIYGGKSDAESIVPHIAFTMNPAFGGKFQACELSITSAMAMLWLIPLLRHYVM